MCDTIDFCTPFKRQREKPTGHIARQDIMPVTETSKINCVLEQGYSTLANKLKSRQVI